MSYKSRISKLEERFDSLLNYDPYADGFIEQLDGQVVEWPGYGVKYRISFEGNGMVTTPIGEG